MKLFTLLLVLILGFAHLNMAQDQIQTPKQNSMSNVFGITTEAGVTLGFTDYNNKINYTGKASLEYYFPSTGKGNFGIRIFGQQAFISGINPPQSAGNPTNEFSTKMDLYGGGALYTISISDGIYPWVGIGLSNLWFYPKDANGKHLPNYSAGSYPIHMIAYNGDAGARIMVSKSISVNIAGGIIVGSKDYLDDIKAGSNNDLLYTATAGLTYYFGRESDEDADGIPNSSDACPNTPFGVKVDEFGCPLDADKDGVPDYLDRCVDTPAKVKVDQDGCPVDFDRDGVPDYLDECSNTPAGVAVDVHGCPLDSDGDGVSDYLDRCPNTPTGIRVNQDGCQIDSDEDGVSDDFDKCPNTQKGVQVDSEGCPIKKDTVMIKQSTEVISLVLSGDTNFEFNKSKLLPNAYTALDGLVNTMKEHPEYKWEVGGYTDAIGSAKYNIKLSQHRAQSVVDYLVSKGVERNNLKIVGYGKVNPIATNDTIEGRSMNRRVEIKQLK